MSVAEYSQELYEAVDRIKDACWLDDVVDDIETVMWYAGLTYDWKHSEFDYDEWNNLLKQAQDILHLDLGR